MRAKIKIKPQKATDLTKGQSISNSVFENFDNDTFPLFFNSYHPEKSFLAVPTTWMKEMAVKAGEPDLAISIDEGVKTVVEIKSSILKDLGVQAKARHQSKVKSKK